MGKLELVREGDGAVLAESVELAFSFKDRLLGLMGRAGHPPGSALLLQPCASIHMMFVRFPIDAIFLDRDLKVLKVASSVRPWIGLAACKGAHATLELAAGEAMRLCLREGQRVLMKEAS
jgi:uncharacterized membrane protein (UPF0127 family)